MVTQKTKSPSQLVALNMDEDVVNSCFFCWRRTFGIKSSYDCMGHCLIFPGLPKQNDGRNLMKKINDKHFYIFIYFM